MYSPNAEILEHMPCALCGCWVEDPVWNVLKPPANTASAWLLQGVWPLRYARVRPYEPIWVCYCRSCRQLGLEWLENYIELTRQWTLNWTLQKRLTVAYRNSHGDRHENRSAASLGTIRQTTLREHMPRASSSQTRADPLMSISEFEM